MTEPVDDVTSVEPWWRARATADIPRLRLFALVAALGWAARGIVDLTTHSTILVGIDLAGSLGSFAVCLWTRTPARFAIGMHAVGAVNFLAILGGVILLGPSRATTGFYFAALPLVMTFLGSLRATAVWTVISLVGVFLQYAWDSMSLLPTNSAPVVFASASEELVRKILLITVMLGLGLATRRSAHDQMEAQRANAETMRAQAEAFELQSAELRKARDEALEAARAKSDFLATMSHEIRTPLNGVLGMTSVLLDAELAPEHHGLVETIRVSGDSLLSLLNDILDFSKVEVGRLSLERAAFDPRDVAEESVDLFGARAAEKNLELVVALDPLLPSQVMGDATRLRQVLVNLVGNAVKFTERGEVVLTAAVEREGVRDPDKVRIHFSVRDTGIGIPEGSIRQLFQTFSQVDASTSRQFGGTGLGLAIVKRLTDLMGGTAWVESEPNKGSTFHATVVVSLAPGLALPVIPRISGLPPSSDRTRKVKGTDDMLTETPPTSRAGLQTALGGAVVRLEDSNQSSRAAIDGLLTSYGLVVLDSGSVANSVVKPTIQILSPDQVPTPGVPLVLLVHPGEQETRAQARFSALSPVIVRKPVRRRALSSAILVAQGGKREVLRSATPFRVLAHPLRVLLAEDDPVNQRVAILILGRLGVRPDVVNNGEEAILAAHKRTYDCILMDVRMPRVDGLTATRAIRAELPKERQPRIIAMTANVMGEDRQACLEAGMNDFVAKPIVVAELVRALEQVEEIAQTSPFTIPPPKRVTSASAIRPGAIQVADIVALRALTSGDVGGLPGLVTSYLSRSNELMEQLAAAVQQFDQSTISTIAHTLKGSSGMFGARTVSGLAGDLEAHARRKVIDEADRETGQRLYLALRKAHEEANAELSQLRD